MSAQIVLFGATGYTGSLVARQLVAAGARPLLAGRDENRLEQLAGELGGLPWRRAEAGDVASVASLLRPGDVLVTTVGPYSRYGETALDAAIEAEAVYLDAAGEPAFIRRVFEQAGDRARTPLLPACGFDYLPGSLAGALALEAAGKAATGVEVGYFVTGSPGLGWASGGTAASTAAATLDPVFAWRGGRLVTERSGRRTRSFDVLGTRRRGVSTGGSEHFTLPRLSSRLRRVDVYLDAGPLPLAAQATALAGQAVSIVPGARLLTAAASRLFETGSRLGPCAETRSKSGTFVSARAYDSAGERLSDVRLTGPNGYDFTARILAWAARRAAAGAVEGRGAVGPVEAFGLEPLERAVAEAGMVRA